MADVVLTHSQDIEAAVASALAHVPLEALVKGRIVAVKPNDTWASKDDTTGITQPDTLRAVRMRFPALSLREASGRFTEAAYGRRLDF